MSEITPQNMYGKQWVLVFLFILPGLVGFILLPALFTIPFIPGSIIFFTVLILMSMLYRKCQSLFCPRCNHPIMFSYFLFGQKSGGSFYPHRRCANCDWPSDIPSISALQKPMS